MIDVMKQALEALEWGQPIIEDYGSKEQLQAHLSAKDALYKAIEADMYRNPDTGNPCEGWDTSDMAHRSGGLSVEQAEKQTHTDHPSRHWDRTCPACVAEAEKQEPKAWIYEGNLHIFDPTDWAIEPESVQPLYTAPPKREFVGLTGLEVSHYNSRLSGSGVAEEIQAKLRERNT